MTERLFVYGTLGPGCPNEHVLEVIGGSWEVASVSGVLHNAGWGAELGYPGIELVENGDEVEGFLFTSESLSDHWVTLDEFEGAAYERLVTAVNRKDGSEVDAWIYRLRQP